MKLIDKIKENSPTIRGEVRLIKPCKISLIDILSRENDIRETNSFSKTFSTQECEDGFFRKEEMLNYNSGSSFFRYFYAPKEGYENTHSLIGVGFSEPSEFGNMLGKPLSIKY